MHNTFKIAFIGCFLCFALFILSCSQRYQTALGIIEKSGIKGGLVVHVGCNDGRLTAALHVNDRYIVHGLSDKKQALEKARQYIEKQKLYGQVSVEHWTKDQLPYTDNLVNLLVLEKPDRLTMDEVMRVLVPNGVAMVKQGGDWQKHQKPLSDEIDDWSHYLHSASNNPVAQDTRVGPPRHLQWKAKPLWSRSHEFTSSLSAMVSSGGRLFYVFDEGLTGMTFEPLAEKWTLIARDAFNGILLWKKPLPHWRTTRWHSNALRARPTSVPRRIVAVKDRLYMTKSLESPISILDPCTGNVVDVVQETAGAQEIVLVNDILLTRIASIELKGQSVKGAISAIDIKTQKIKWQIPEDRYQSGTLATDHERVIYHTGNTLCCRKLQNGSELWSVSDEEPGGTFIIHNGLVFRGSGQGIETRSAITGEMKWSVSANGKSMRGNDIFVAKGLVWHADGDFITGYDLETGNPKQKIDPSDVQSWGHHLRCYRAKATSEYFITQYRGAEYISMTGKPNCQNDWLRGACTYGVLPCNGLLYVPPHPCFCYPGAKLSGFNAFASSVMTEDYEQSDRLERGPAYQDMQNKNVQPVSSTDWPTYRYDNRRSAATNNSVPSDLAVNWRVKFDEKCTPPVFAGDNVYVAVKDKHTVYALNGDNGEKKWTFIAGGRIDSPPTVYGELLLFGCADGYVYCLRNKDGKQVWRFRAAPSVRRIVVFDQLESPWHVHGSILVEDGVAYFTAGRSTFLDGGIYVYGLDPVSGQLLHQTCVNTWSRTRKDAQNKPFIPAYHMEGAQSDILVCENDYIYLGQYKFDKQLNQQDVPYVDPNNTENALRIEDQPYAAQNTDPEMDYETRQRDWLERTQRHNIAQYKHIFGGWSLGRRKMGRHIIAPWGFLDDSWFNRTYWTYSDTWPGYYLTHRAAKTGQLLVLGQDKTYALQAFPARNFQSPLHNQKKGYLLLAEDRDAEPVLSPITQGTTKGWGFTRSKPPSWHKWLPIRVRAMVKAGDKLILAGPIDKIDSKYPYAMFEGRIGGQLWIISDDQVTLKKYNLDSPVVFDGMIAADGSLYLSGLDNQLMSLGAK
jgi:outer membrane protein assembly factor BamB